MTKSDPFTQSLRCIFFCESHVLLRTLRFSKNIRLELAQKSQLLGNYHA